MDSAEIIKEMLAQMLNPNPNRLAEIQKEILSRPSCCLVAARGTAEEDWNSQPFPVFIDEKKSLIIFLFPEEAAAFAEKHGCVLHDGQPMSRSVDTKTLLEIIARCAEEGQINRIKIYARVPVGLEFPPQAFCGRFTKDSTDMAGNLAPPLCSANWVGVDEVKKVLEIYERNTRRKYDPGARYENIHSLIETLIHQNCLDPADVDTALDLPSGFTRDFIRNYKQGNPSIEVMKKLLSYFGLNGYLYLYSKDSRDLAQYLKKHPKIDTCKLKYPAALNAEHFRLEQIERGHDGDAFVYRITLTGSSGNTQTLIVSNPLNPPLIIGRQYQLMNADGSPRKVDTESPGSMALPDVPDRIENDYDEKPADSKKSSPRSYEEIRKDTIIRYFRQHMSINARSAEGKYKELEVDEEVLDAFYKYIEKKTLKGFEVCGYTPQKLIKEMKYSPYEAFILLIRLKTDPKNTKQELVYRERDPQYQKNPKPKGV